ncbi:MAG: hypothetical protein U0R71_16345 [Solirubrobacterales bacterium]
MSAFRPTRAKLAALLASLAGIAVLVPAAGAGAATFNNACVNNILVSQASLIPVTMTAKPSPSPVQPGGAVTLGEIKQELSIPPTVFLSGYSLELLSAGLNKVPTTVQTSIAASNTDENVQATNVAEGFAETTITDPDGTPGNKSPGEEATPGKVAVTYANQTWHAAGNGEIKFRENTVTDPTAVNPPGFSFANAGIKIEAKVGTGGAIKAKFGCDPGEVEETADPSTIKRTDTAAAFATVKVESGGGSGGGGGGSGGGGGGSVDTKFKSLKVNGHNVTIKFGSSTGGATFQCKLDKKKFAKCKSPKTYKNLKPGKHTFKVKAGAGGTYDSSPVVKKFTIKKG